MPARAAAVAIRRLLPLLLLTKAIAPRRVLHVNGQRQGLQQADKVHAVCCVAVMKDIFSPEALATLDMNYGDDGGHSHCSLVASNGTRTGGRQRVQLRSQASAGFLSAAFYAALGLQWRKSLVKPQDRPRHAVSGAHTLCCSLVLCVH